jgi:hypothetical protein
MKESKDKERLFKEHSTVVQRSKYCGGLTAPTPLSIARKMVDRIPVDTLKNPDSRFIDPCAGIGTFAIALIEKLVDYHNFDYIISEMITLVDSSPSRFWLMKRIGFKNVFKECSLDREYTMKFDVALGNPPYKKGLHLRFLDKMSQVADRVILVHPSAWILTKTHDKKMTGPEETCVNLVKEHETEFEFINGNKEFDALFSAPVIITSIDKTKPNDGFKIIDQMNDRVNNFKSFDDINLNCSDDVFVNLRKKIVNIVKQDNFFSNANINTPNNYSVRISKIRGSLCRENFFKNDFYTAVPRDVSAVRVDKVDENDFQFYSSSEEEANNMIDFLKSDFARFCLSVYKVTTNIKSGSIHKSIPVVDFTQSWDDSKLYNHFNITEEEQEWIRKIIPPFYS